jgi:hypothetical protein
MSKKNKKVSDTESSVLNEKVSETLNEQTQSVSDTRISFEEWWISRSKLVPEVHTKEIIRADFTGRGLGEKAEPHEWDSALALYGVKL